jgi:hypothetical protein
MSFGLKNAGANSTRTSRLYVDDVVVKTRNSDTLIADLEETFTSLREY